MAANLLRNVRKKGHRCMKPDKETEKFYAQQNERVTVYPYTNNPTMAWERLQVKQHVEPVSPMNPKEPVHEGRLRFVCVSDTHSRTRYPDMVSIPPGDVLLHAGDFTMVGQPKEVEAFNEWLGTMPHPHKVVIAGNHDLMFEDGKLESDWVWWDLDPKKIRKMLSEKNVSHVRELLTNCTYLEDAETSVCGIRIYGSPWQPEFGNWAFNLKRGEKCLEKWNKIPEGIDVLMTHGPPIGHGDMTSGHQRAGCVELLHTIQQHVKPKYHVFGHIHEAAGITTDGTTTYINACTCDLRYRPRQHAIVFDLPIPEGHTKAEVLEKLTVISHADIQKEKKHKKLDGVILGEDDEDVIFDSDYDLELTDTENGVSNLDMNSSSSPENKSC